MLETMEHFFENRLEGYDQHMLSNIGGAAEFYPFTAGQLLKQEGCSVLDLGCGTGLELEAYFSINPTARITGIDLSAAMLKKLTEKFPGKHLNLIHASYFDVPFENQAFDAAVSVESLHHFTAQQKTQLYQKLFRALKQDGYFILTDYFAESDALEREYFQTLKTLKQRQNITDNAFYHYDTPLTVEHEINILKKAGFSHTEVLKHWGATYTVRAER